MYQVPQDNCCNVAFRADYEESPEALNYRMMSAQQQLSSHLIEAMKPEQWYAVRWYVSVTPDFYRMRNEYRLTFELNPAQSKRIAITRYDEMPLGRLALTAVDELKRRWRGRFASWRRFFDWLEEAQGWR